MRLFSEKVSPTLTNSPLNIIRVKDFSEIFFGVYEIEINKNKYPVEKISEHNGDPVVSVPVEMGGKTVNYPFVLTKGKFEILFNEQNSDFEIFESDIQNEPLIFTEEDRLIKLKVWDDRKNEILIQIEEAKKNALVAAKKEIEVRKNRQLKHIREESNQKKQALSQYLESARENLVDEFTTISHRIKDELVSDNDNKLSEIKETVDNKIQDLADSLRESLKKDFNNSSNLVDKSIRNLVKELYEKNINPRVDKELQNIAVEIHEKVSEIDKNLKSKLDTKADTSLLEGVNKEIGAIRDANIELNNSLNKGVQKALSRVGNVDKKIIQISEEFERKLDEKEQEVVNYFDEKLELVKEETLDITDEARKYFQNLIQESRNNLLLEIRKIKAEKPIEYVLETKNSGKIVKDWDTIEKDWNTKIHDKIENVKTDLRKYVTVYASGGGTNATQYQDGGTMNGDLNVTGSYLSAGVNLLDIFGGGGGGSDVSSLSSNWEATYLKSGIWDSTFATVSSLSSNWEATYLKSGIWDSTFATVSSLSANWENTYSQVNSLSSTWDYQGTDIKSLSANWQNTYSQVNSLSSTWGGGGLGTGVATALAVNLGSAGALARLSDVTGTNSGTNTGDQFTAVTSQRLIGRHAGGSGAAQEVQVGDGIEFSGGAIQRSALTGDVTAAAGSNSTTLAGTIAGDKTLSGQLELTGQAATTANSAMTRSLCEASFSNPITQNGTIVQVPATALQRSTLLNGGTNTISNFTIQRPRVSCTTTLNSSAVLRAQAFDGISTRVNASNQKLFADKFGWVLIGFLGARGVGTRSKVIIGGNSTPAEMIVEGTLGSNGIALESQPLVANTPRFRLVVRNGATTTVGSFSGTGVYSTNFLGQWWIVMESGTTNAYYRLEQGPWILICSVAAVPASSTVGGGNGVAIVAYTPDSGAAGGTTIQLNQIYETFGITPD